MVKIEDQLTTTDKHWGDDSDKSSITVHETANRSRGAGAQAHANLQANGNVRKASWHIQVDDIEAIRSFPDNMRLWHASPQGADSLSLEICVNEDSDYDKALENAADVVRQWREKYDLGRGDVKNHHYWTGKDCPDILLSRGQSAWENFVAATDPGSSSKPSKGGSESGGSSSSKADGRKSISTLAKEVIDGKYGSGEDRKRALGSRYDAVQDEVNRRLSGDSSGGGSRKSTAQLAKEVIDGKHGSGDARKKSLGSRYSAVQAEVNRRLSGGGSSGGGGRKSTATLAQEVIDGRHGSGEARRRALGGRYKAVQAEVNRRLSGGNGSSGSRSSISRLAQEVINGEWGNEPSRSRRLRAAGHNAAAVQREVNRRYR